jgi:hypothetical protein
MDEHERVDEDHDGQARPTDREDAAGMDEHERGRPLGHEARRRSAALARALTVLRLGLELLDDAAPAPIAHSAHTANRALLKRMLRAAVDQAAAAAPPPPGGGGV